MQGGSKARQPRGGGKRAVNRHQTQSKASAGAQERVEERKVRQAGQREIRAELAETKPVRVFVIRDRTGILHDQFYFSEAEANAVREGLAADARYAQTYVECLVPDTVAAHAGHWNALAAQERARLQWDKTALPALVETRAKLYEGAARSIELEAATGVPHCACHLIPMKACAERAAAVRNVRR